MSPRRVALLTKQVDMANDILKIVQAGFDAGSVSEARCCRAKSLHVGLKIRLLRERNSKRPPISTPPGKQPMKSLRPIVGRIAERSLKRSTTP